MPANITKSSWWGATAPLPTSCAVDWITQVYSEPEQRERARFRVGLWQLDEQRKGNFFSNFTVGGMCGLTVGGTAFAASEARAVAQVSGQESRSRWRDLVAIGGSTSRLDLQLTCELGPGSRCPARGSYVPSRRALRVGRPVTSRTLIQGSDGGVTLYAGASSSESRLRVYDKGVESGSHPPGKLYRWELQLRRKLAQAAVNELRAAPDPAVCISSIIRGDALRRAVRIPDAFGGPLTLLRCGSTTDTIASLEWLARGVAPSVARLVAHGQLDAVLAALDLERHLPSRGG
jgi:DNA relaxase NicK